jgi:hypothetical protein
VPYTQSSAESVLQGTATIEELLLLTEELLAIDELETGTVSLDKGRTEELLSVTDDTVSDDSTAEEEESAGPEASPLSQATRNKAKERAKKVIRISAFSNTNIQN